MFAVWCVLLDVQCGLRVARSSLSVCAGRNALLVRCVVCCAFVVGCVLGAVRSDLRIVCSSLCDVCVSCLTFVVRGVMLVVCWWLSAMCYVLRVLCFVRCAG